MNTVFPPSGMKPDCAWPCSRERNQIRRAAIKAHLAALPGPTSSPTPSLSPGPPPSSSPSTSPSPSPSPSITKKGSAGKKPVRAVGLRRGPWRLTTR